MRDAPREDGIVALWSAPRSRSTAFFRMMLERGDMLTLHEPFCNLVNHGETDIGERQVHSVRELLDAMWAHSTRRMVFLKDTTDNRYPEMLADHTFLARARHTFLLRHPRETIPSYCELRPDMSLDEVGIAHLYEIHEAVTRHGGQPVVVDSDDLVRDPVATVTAYCQAVGIPFIPEALSWQAGDVPQWRRSSRWHVDASRSTGMQLRRRSYQRTVDNDPRLRAMYDHHLPFYELLRARRLPV